MLEFKKYSSIDNHYQSKSVIFWLKRFPELKNEVFILTEKLDGSNIQLVFTPGEEMLVGKRTSFLTPGAKFFDIWNVLSRYDAELSVLQRYADDLGESVRVFGELYGPGINGRINYGDKKKIKFFDMYIDDVLYSPAQLSAKMAELGLEHMLVPTLSMVTGLENALDFSCDFDSTVLNIKGNIAEGFVMRPYFQVYRMPSGERFVFKKKSKAFADKENKGNKDKKPREPLDANIIRLVSDFQGYINENRMIDTFSKHGEIESPKQIGDYIRLILEDAKADFLKDNPDLILDKNTAKIVFNVGKTIVEMLKKRL